MLTGQGGFGSYLYNISKVDSPDCLCCGVRKSCYHIVFDCVLHVLARRLSGIDKYINYSEITINWTSDGLATKCFSKFAKIAICKIQKLRAQCDR